VRVHFQAQAYFDFLHELRFGHRKAGMFRKPNPLTGVWEGPA
jgi:hypothetical protein